MSTTDQNAQALAAWRHIHDGFEAALEELDLDHPLRPQILRMDSYVSVAGSISRFRVVEEKSHA